MQWTLLKSTRSCLSGVIVLGVYGMASAQAFKEIAKEVGLDYLQLGHENYPAALIEAVHETGGAAARDFDKDGWVDLVVTRMDGDPILYRNVPDPSASGGRRFVDVTEGTGIENVEASNGVAWGDIDNDGDADLFFTTFSTRYYLFMNDGSGKFTEQAIDRGVDQTIVPEQGIAHTGFSAAFGDYDRDGYLDLATAEWLNALLNPVPVRKSKERRFHLLRNLGKEKPAHFVNVTDEAGVNTFPQSVTVSFTPRFTDLDMDGWPDLTVTSDLQTSKIYWNNHNGTFSDGTIPAGVGTDQSGMGSAIGDFDRDGDFDWFVTSVSQGLGQNGNRLYMNRMIRAGGSRPGEPRSFADVTNIGVRDGIWGWGASYIDYDNDSWLDLVMTNGISHYDFAKDDPMRFFRNEGAGGKPTFTEMAVELGLTDTQNGKALVLLDYDNDGDHDIFITNNLGRPLLYHNDVGSANPWLKLQLVGTKSNRDAAGAFIRLEDEQLGGAKTPLIFEYNCSGGYLGQNEQPALFGLGKNFTGTIDSILIRWPSGDEQIFRDITPRQTLEAVEGSNDLRVVTPK